MFTVLFKLIRDKQRSNIFHLLHTHCIEATPTATSFSHSVEYKNLPFTYKKASFKTETRQLLLKETKQNFFKRERRKPSAY